MIGYKMFEWGVVAKKWCGPYFPSPWNWEVRISRTLKEYRLNEERGRVCGQGVNFKKRLKDAKSLLVECSAFKDLAIIFKGHTTKNAKVIVPFMDKTMARTDSFRLDSIEGIYFGGRRVNKLPPRSIRGDVGKMIAFYGKKPYANR